MLIMVCKKCGSTLIDVNGWKRNKAEFRCYSCGYTELISGFSGGRLWDINKKNIIETMKDIPFFGENPQAFQEKITDEIYRMAVSGEITDVSDEEMEFAKARLNNA